MAFSLKTNLFDGLEGHKVRCVIRDDRMRPGLDSEDMLTASHMPSKSGRCLLRATAPAESYAVTSFDVPGTYARSSNDPRLRVTKKQPPRAGSFLAATEMIGVMRRAYKTSPL